MPRLGQIAALLLLVLAACTKAQPVEPATPRAVVLTWQACAKATSYNIYRAKVGATYQKVGTSVTTTYTDPQVPGRTSFFYTVTALNEKGESEPSKRLVVAIP
jgi:hypothetical protein